MDRVDAMRKMNTLLPELGDDEINVLVRVTERLRGGADAYGELSIATDRRNWVVEALAEVLDCQVYTACALLRIARAGANASELKSRDADDFVEGMP